MIRKWTDNGWRRRFAWFPIYLNDGPNKTLIWLEWVWMRSMGEYTEIRLYDPENPQP